MSKKIVAVFFVAAALLPLAIFGCKGKVEKTPDVSVTEATDVIMPADDLSRTSEPAQNVATETIPPTATAPQAPVEKEPTVRQEKAARDKEVQIALKNAGFYTGAVDGKIGPKTKKAIQEFQKAKGLKVDGKVGPMTWAELEKYLNQ